jgi:hypothetical protein
MKEARQPTEIGKVAHSIVRSDLVVGSRDTCGYLQLKVSEDNRDQLLRGLIGHLRRQHRSQRYL